MPTLPPPMQPTSILGLLREQFTRLAVRLSAASPPLEASPIGPIEIAFPGYKPRDHVFRLVPPSESDDGVNLSCNAAFTRTEPGPPVIAAGCYVTYNSALGGVSHVFSNEFPAPFLLTNQNDSVRVSLSLRAVNGPGPEVNAAQIFGFCRAISWKGESTMYALAGQDKALVQGTLAGLNALLRRDTTLHELSARSTRSRVPLVPQEDTELARAVTLVAQRLELLLAAAT